MVRRPRLRAVVTTLGLYAVAAALIGYFAVNAYSGNHGLKARADLDQRIAELSVELGKIRAERETWQRRVALLRADRLDPDMLDERARLMLNFTDPRDVIMLVKRP